MLKQMLKIVITFMVILFFSLYFMQLSNYNNYAINKKTVLTDDAIKRFEEDVKNGVDIETSNYLVEEKNYNNNFSIFGMKLSSFIEKEFNKTMVNIFKEINTTVLDKNK